MKTPKFLVRILKALGLCRDKTPREPSVELCYGTIKGLGVVEKGAVIADLRVNATGLTFRWEKGGCEQLGAQTRSDYRHTFAMLFVKGLDGKWRGGKFDEISTSRTSRDFKNIERGYGGWPRDAIRTARGYAFCICSQGGSRRTNIIVQE